MMYEVIDRETGNPISDHPLDLAGACLLRDHIETGGDPYIAPVSCRWFALCDQYATELVPHPILGDVPACTRCAQRAAC